VTPVEEFTKPPKEEMTKVKKPKFRKIFSRYADIASLNGVAIIKDSKSPIVKAIWAFLLLAAIGAMIYHLYSLFTKFFQYEKHAEIDMSFSNLPFPAVTICNANIMRLSKQDLASAEIQDLVQKVSTSYKQIVEADDYNSISDFDSALDFLDNSSQYEDQEYFYDDYPTVDDSVTQSEDDEVDASIFSKAESQFQELFSQMDVETQRKVGHTLEDLIVQCTIGRKPCRNFKNFTVTTTSSFGNCYTIEYKNYTASKNGPDGGLELVLFLELDEYLPGITGGKGAQIVIHPQGSYPFVEEEGIPIAAGSQTIISLKQIQIERLGDPYNKCTNNGDQDFGTYSYTRSLCQKKCALSIIIQNCSCYDKDFKGLNSLLNVSSTLKACSGSEQTKCRLNVTKNYKDEDSTCNCNNPCSESIYDKSISTKQWPSKAMARSLIKEVCNKSERCDELWGLNNEDLQENFVKLNIYFQDLNFEKRAEQPNYELFQLLSDFGGTIGLWIGLSILAIFELFDVLFQLVHCVICGRRK
ncbi:degenerin unc-8, partial [Biomphalaria glabrata]